MPMLFSELCFRVCRGAVAKSCRKLCCYIFGLGSPISIGFNYPRRSRFAARCWRCFALSLSRRVFAQLLAAWRLAATTKAPPEWRKGRKRGHQQGRCIQYVLSLTLCGTISVKRPRDALSVLLTNPTASTPWLSVWPELFNGALSFCLLCQSLP